MKKIDTYIRQALLKIADKIFEKYGIVPPYRIPLRERAVEELNAEQIIDSTVRDILDGKYGADLAHKYMDKLKRGLLMHLRDGLVDKDLVEFGFLNSGNNTEVLRARLRILRPDTFARLDNIYPVPDSLKSFGK